MDCSVQKHGNSGFAGEREGDYSGVMDQEIGKSENGMIL